MWYLRMVVSKVQKVVLAVCEALHNSCVVLAIHLLLFPNKLVKVGGSATGWLPIGFYYLDLRTGPEGNVHLCFYI